MKTALVLPILALSVLLTFLWAQTPPSPGSGSVVLNSHDLKWEAEGGSESATLREDPKTGATELIARYPAGHVFQPHWHDANERILLLEGRLSIQQGPKTTYLEPNGFAFLPAKEVQKMACVSSSRCAFYVFWDGRLKTHKAAAE